MSLLLDALKKAEQSKQQAAKDTSESKNQAEASNKAEANAELTLSETTPRADKSSPASKGASSAGLEIDTSGLSLAGHDDPVEKSYGQNSFEEDDHADVPCLELEDQANELAEQVDEVSEPEEEIAGEILLTDGYTEDDFVERSAISGSAKHDNANMASGTGMSPGGA